MKFLSLFFALFLGLSATAQNSISIYPYMSLTKTNSKTFSEFLDSYGNYNSQYITSQQDDISAGIGFGFGIRAVLYGHLLIPFEYSSLRSSTDIEFTDGSMRSFDFRSGGFTFGMGYSLQSVSKPFYMYPEFGITLGKDKIISSFSAGTGSFNPSALNGTFDGSLSGKFYLGLGAAVGTERFKVMGRVQYYFPIASSELVDADKEMSAYGTHYIPVDYPTWITDPVDYFGPTVEDDFKLLNFTLGIVYEIPFESEY
jgi:hypothetical protein